MGARRPSCLPVRRRIRRFCARSRGARSTGVRARRPTPRTAAQGARVATARSTRANDEAEVPDRGRQRADRGRTGGAGPRRAAPLREPASRRQGARRGRHVDRIRLTRGPPRRDTPSRARRSRRPTRLQRIREDDADEPPGWQDRAYAWRDQRGSTVHLAHLPKTPPRFPGTNGFSSHWRQSRALRP